MNPKQIKNSEQLAMAMQHLKELATVDENTISEVALEATSHIMDHFVIQKGERFQSDYCFIFYNAFLGMSKQRPEDEVQAIGMYKAGNDHVGAHQLARLMRIDPQVRELIFHAVHAFHHDPA